jgi:hypothetical protein
MLEHEPIVCSAIEQHPIVQTFLDCEHEGRKSTLWPYLSSCILEHFDWICEDGHDVQGRNVPAPSRKVFDRRIRGVARKLGG